MSAGYLSARVRSHVEEREQLKQYVYAQRCMSSTVGPCFISVGAPREAGRALAATSSDENITMKPDVLLQLPPL